MNQANAADIRRRIKANTVIDDSGCWNWQLSITWNGYGQMTYYPTPTRRIQTKAHRLAYRAFVREVPDGIDVCHKCDNRRCCNPKHLFAGTRSMNMQDCIRKGRFVDNLSLLRWKKSWESSNANR